MSDRIQGLGDAFCLAFPFRVGPSGPETRSARDRVREQIEQVLFTTPGERVFRPEFGGGVKTLVFEPNNTPVWEVTRRRILAALGDTLRGEIEPASLDVRVEGTDERLEIVVSYRLVAVGAAELQRFVTGGPGHG
jgi:hypothetical protein